MASLHVGWCGNRWIITNRNYWGVFTENLTSGEVGGINGSAPPAYNTVHDAIEVYLSHPARRDRIRQRADGSMPIITVPYCTIRVDEYGFTYIVHHGKTRSTLHWNHVYSTYMFATGKNMYPISKVPDSHLDEALDGMQRAGGIALAWVRENTSYRAK